MPSKAFQRFDNRVSAYDSDLELADLLVRRFRSQTNSETSVCEALGGDTVQYPNLNRRTNTRKSRNIVGSHLKATLYAAFTKDLYEDFSEFLASSLNRAALAGVNAAQFQGDVKIDFQAREILKTGSWEAAIALVSEKIFRALENERSTITLVTKVSSRLGLNLEQRVIADAMPYLDARHILVHRDGRVDDQYAEKYPEIPIRNGRIRLDYGFVQQARACVKCLALHIDERLCAAGLVRPQDMTGGRQG